MPRKKSQACEVNIKQKKKSKERKNYLQSIKSKPKLVIVVVFWCEREGERRVLGSPGGAAVLIFSSKTGDGGKNGTGRVEAFGRRLGVFFKFDSEKTLLIRVPNSITAANPEL